ncbi:MAG: hypothetical protein ABSB89_03530 [Candidatus Bathyarchaeia archaeon]|jgi:FtsZ-binding cell division protein ZapB
MSLPKEISELRDRRANLEAERRSLTDEKKKKKERLKALEQMMIVELANCNEKMRQDLSQLDASINNLENRLEQARQEAENQNNELNQANEVHMQTWAAALEESPIQVEEASTETTSESSVPSSENKNEITNQESQKKKR